MWLNFSPKDIIVRELFSNIFFLEWFYFIQKMENTRLHFLHSQFLLYAMADP